ncbi:MAG: SRPBCC domain-containing protein [Pseudomonadota bacterium]
MPANAQPETRSETPDFVLETEIKCSPERLWSALTETSHMQLYHFAMCSVKTTMKQGGRFDHYFPDGNLMFGGKIISIDPPNRMEMTFEPTFFGPDAPASRCTYEIEKTAVGCRFTVLHFAIPEGQDGVKEGWENIAARLKAYLEHGTTNQEYVA